ncbi:MAG: hypothetical protein JNL57_12810 [Bacteroidetes bacterium]|nr:hypothetical protein [Bacteroidota bacterium]
MTTAIKIHTTPAELPAMRYEELRQTGLAYIQQKCGKVWTDHNTHDPGITIMEALAYAITDLGYRMNFSIQDILASNPAGDLDYRNFYTARTILHNRPLTVDDYRRLLMDTSLNVAVNGVTEELGIKNAWLSKSAVAELPVYVDHKAGTLSLSATDSDSAGYFVQGLWDVLLEFDESTELGDLNSSALECDYQVNLFAPDPNLQGVQVHFRLVFPRWDNQGIDFSNPPSVKASVKSIQVEFEEVPSGYTLEAKLGPAGVVLISGTRPKTGGNEPIPGLAQLQSDINTFLYDSPNGALALYMQKAAVCRNLAREANQALQQNRNLCEDWYGLKALKIEAIAICADIELDNTAQINQVQAEIEYRVGQFLSPTVYYYSLEEMLVKVDANGNTYRSEDIFSGPRLRHGFVDQTELDKTTLRDCIHVSDVLHIIMDVPGVKAVRSLQLANIPEDPADLVPSHSVKWCLDLAIEKFYVPRYSQEFSKITFYKENLPLRADETDTALLLEELVAGDRPRYPQNPKMDREVPQGNWREPETHISVQEDFPNTYGIGIYGLPANADNKRKAQAWQLKAYLTFFDQLLANFLSQYAHIRELFSMHNGVDEFGDLIFDKTYFSQPLPTVIPDGNVLYTDTAGHGVRLQQMVEDKATFEQRKNGFLDHVLARFCEQFADYALLLFTTEGELTASELIKDKLDFLNKYPEISYNRGGAVDYTASPLWHLQEAAGYEKRVKACLGVNDPLPSSLHFGSLFSFSGTEPSLVWASNAGGTASITSSGTYSTTPVRAVSAELALASGCNPASWAVEPGSPAGKYKFSLYSDSARTQKLAESDKKNYASIAAAKTDADKLLSAMQQEMQTRFMNSRLNLAIDFDAWFTTTAVADKTQDPPICGVEYKLYNQPYDYNPAHVVLTGTIWKEGKSAVQAELLADAEASKHELLWSMLRYAGFDLNYSFDPALLPYGANYTFVLSDIRGTEIGRGKAVNFNQSLAAKLAPGSLTLTGTNGNDGIWQVTAASADGPLVRCTLSSALPVADPTGTAVWIHEHASAAISAARKFVVSAQDLRQWLAPGDSFDFTGGDHSNGKYTVRQIWLDGADTHITVAEPIPADDTGKLYLEIAFRIQTANAKDLVIYGGMEMKAVEQLVSFINRNFIEREGMHVLEHVLLRPRTKPGDDLLAIETEGDCEDCKINDPYSFVMSVVMPYWPGKFRDRHFRQYCESRIRAEAPAHVAMNICWVNPVQMARFEVKYRAWLFAKNAMPYDAAAFSKAQNELIEILQELRSVYPEGLLHNCETDTNKPRNAVILNQTALGRP